MKKQYDSCKGETVSYFKKARVRVSASVCCFFIKHLARLLSAGFDARRSRSSEMSFWQRDFMTFLLCTDRLNKFDNMGSRFGCFDLLTSMS
jgi:hypothetical protein